MSDNLKIKNIDNTAFLLGNNEFESGVITLAAGAKVDLGDMLKRDSGTGKFSKVTDTSTEIPVALATCDLTNTGSASKDYAARVLIGGKVDASFVTVNSVAATKAQYDMVRSYGIIPVPTAEINMKDNQ